MLRRAGDWGRIVLVGSTAAVGHQRLSDTLAVGDAHVIAEACALIALESTNEELSRIVHPHPTLAEGMLEASHAAAGHPLGF